MVLVKVVESRRGDAEVWQRVKKLRVRTKRPCRMGRSLRSVNRQVHKQDSANFAC